MNKDNSTKKIDIVKLLLWLSVFLITIFSLSALLIIPSINKLKIANDILNQSTQKLNMNEGRLNDISQQLESYLSEHKKELDKLHSDFNIERFSKHCQSFFDEVRLEKALDLHDEYVSYQLFVSTKINSPTVLYNFIDSLDNYPNILKVHFPIILKSEKDQIKAQFNLQVYRR